MLSHRCAPAIAFCLLLALSTSFSASAHEREFPDTHFTEDPDVPEDELQFEAEFERIAESGHEGRQTATTEVGAEYTKAIAPGFSVALGGHRVYIDPEGGPSQQGFDNIEVEARYQAVADPVHETSLSFGLDADIGDTGQRTADANPHSTLSPVFLLAKGFGDLPNQARFLRPLAVNLRLAGNIPTRARDDEDEAIPATLDSGIALLYDLDYLNRHITHGKEHALLTHLFPLAELGAETCLNRGCEGDTNVQAQSGLIWLREPLLLEVAANVHFSGEEQGEVGVFALMQLTLEDVYAGLKDRLHAAK